MGNAAAALPLCRQAVEIRRATLGENHPDYVTTLSSLAMLYRAMGDLAAALPLYRQAVEICRATLGEGHPNYATSLNNLAVMYRAMGDYSAALPLCHQALEIQRAALGESHPDYATTLNNLAELYREMGDHNAALPLIRQAVEIRRATLGESHPRYAQSLNNLALLYEETGDYAAALPLYRQAMEIRRAALGESHPHYAQSLNNLAWLYMKAGDHAAAVQVCRQAVQIGRTVLGDSDQVYDASLNNLAFLFAATGRASEALQVMEQAAAIADRMIGQVLSIGSERQIISFLTTQAGRFFRTLSLVLKYHYESPSGVCSALDLVLRRKAITAEVRASQREAVLGGRYPALEPKLRELAALRMQIARKTLAGPGPEALASHRQELANLETEKESLEAELASQIPEMNLEQKLRAADRRAVALGLPEGVVLVEFVRFPVFDFQAMPARGESAWKSPCYVAFVVPGGAPDEVQMIDLGEAEPIDLLIADFRAGIIAEAETGDERDMARWREEASPTIANDAGLALRAATFDVLAPALGGRTRLLIAPDGDLTRLPFEVLSTEDGRRLIDDYQVSYVTCGRDVLRFGTESTGRPGEPLVVADPDFDLEAMIVAEPAPARPGFWSRLLGRAKKAVETPTPSVPSRETAAPSSGRQSRDLDRNRSAYHFHRLPGTRAEGEQIATRLGVSPWLDATALEGRLKTACRSPSILHLATHGFFLPDQERDLNREGRGLGFDFGGFSGRRTARAGSRVR